MEKQLVLAALALVLAFSADAPAEEDPHAKHRAMMHQSADSAPEAADIDLRDRTLVNQHGQDVRFVSDVIGEKIVVMDFVYTTCTTICPVLTALFTQVQGELGERSAGGDRQGRFVAGEFRAVGAEMAHAVGRAAAAGLVQRRLGVRHTLDHHAMVQKRDHHGQQGGLLAAVQRGR